MMDIESVEWWTFDLVREALVEVLDMWRRSPGDGRSPFATDGPWHLMTRETDAGDYDARGGFGSSSDVAEARGCAARRTRLLVLRTRLPAGAVAQNQAPDGRRAGRAWPAQAVRTRGQCNRRRAERRRIPKVETVKR